MASFYLICVSIEHTCAWSALSPVLLCCAALHFLHTSFWRGEWKLFTCHLNFYYVFVFSAKSGIFQRALTSHSVKMESQVWVWLYQKLKCNAMQCTCMATLCRSASLKPYSKSWMWDDDKGKRDRVRTQVTDSCWVEKSGTHRERVTTNKCNWLNFIKCCCNKTSINYLRGGGGQRQKTDTVLSTFHNYLYALPHAQKLCVCIKLVKCVVCCTWIAYVILPFHRILL